MACTDQYQTNHTEGCAGNKRTFHCSGTPEPNIAFLVAIWPYPGYERSCLISLTANSVRDTIDEKQSKSTQNLLSRRNAGALLASVLQVHECRGNTSKDKGTRRADRFDWALH